MKFKIILTWSKIMALLVLGSAVWLDLNSSGTSTFIYALPFIVFLITGKQFFDRNKTEK